MSSDRGLVAITGANGTIGYASVLHALRLGYRVRCIVRRSDAIAYIKQGPSIQQFVDRINFFVVPDNTVVGAYDNALEGAQYVIHIAGVWPMPNYHPDEDIYYPFVKSMENILSGAEKSGTVTRVVFTQAGAGLVNLDDGDTLGTEMDQVLDEYVEANKKSVAFRPPLKSVHHAYSGAKAYCMEYLKSAKAKFPFSIVQVIPGTVIGPSELINSAPDAYAHMDRMSRALLFNEMKPKYAFGFVHVNACAAVHVEALDEGKLPNEKIPAWLVAAAPTEEGKSIQQIWKEVGDMVESQFSEQVNSGLFTVGRNNLPINVPFRVNSTWTERTLLGGDRFRGLRDAVKEVAEWYVDLTSSTKMSDGP